MKTETRERVDAMLAALRDGEVTNEIFDSAEALYVFAHDCGEYQLLSTLLDMTFRPHLFLATGEERGLTEEGWTIYRELLQMEGLVDG